MGLFDGNKAELQARLLELEKQVAVKDNLLNQKTEEVEHLRKQVDRLQDAVLAVQHPEAYRQLKDDEYLSEHPEGYLEASEEAKQKQEYFNRYLEEVENPTFTDVSDMLDSLKFLSGSSNLKSKSLHGNEES
jgi:hypothetical protein